MTLFDRFTLAYESRYSALIDFCVAFDHSEWMWKMRHEKWEEFKERRRLQKEIYDKQAEGDEIS